MESVNKILRDEMIKHQVGLLRLSSAITAKLVTLLNRTEDDILSQLSTKLGNARLNAVLAGVRDTLDAARSDQYEMLTKELTGLANYEPKFVKILLQGQIPVKLNMATPSTDMLASIVTSQPFQGKLLKEWVEDLSDSRRKMIRDAVRMGMVEGQTVDQIAKRIRGTRALQYKDGLMEISRRGAQAMVRTAVNHTATAARDLTYSKNQDIIKEVQWVSTLDNRTTPICQALDGKTYPVDEGPRPPAHINCRSIIAPVTKSWRELGFDIDEAPESTRASFDGQVPESTTYNDWLKGQTPEFQDSILGPGRGKLFREGMSVDKFVDLESGRPFTLKELAGMDMVSAPDVLTMPVWKPIQDPSDGPMIYESFKKWKISPQAGFGMPPAKYKEILNAVGADFTRLETDFPNIIKALEATDRTSSLFLEYQKSLSNNMQGGYLPMSKNIYIASKTGSWKSMAPQVGKFTSTASKLGVVRHETAHKIWPKLDTLQIDAKKRWSALYKSLDAKTIEKSISKYGATNFEEGFAEAFAVFTNPKYGVSGKRLQKDVEDYMIDIFGQHPNLK